MGLICHYLAPEHGPFFPPCGVGQGGKNPHVRVPDNVESIPHQLCFKGLFILGGVKLTYTINRQEGSLVTGAGAGSKHRNQEPEPREPIPDMLLFLKEKYTMPQWAGISAAIG